MQEQIADSTDGPTEVHKVTLARELLNNVTPATTMFPSYMRQQLTDEVHALYDDLIEGVPA
ncbi:MAG: hypothetical protein ABI781_13380 [Burkholderiales bacterium]